MLLFNPYFYYYLIKVETRNIRLVVEAKQKGYGSAEERTEASYGNWAIVIRMMDRSPGTLKMLNELQDDSIVEVGTMQYPLGKCSRFKIQMFKIYVQDPCTSAQPQSYESQESRETPAELFCDHRSTRSTSEDCCRNAARSKLYHLQWKTFNHFPQ